MSNEGCGVCNGDIIKGAILYGEDDYSSLNLIVTKKYLYQK